MSMKEESIDYWRGYRQAIDDHVILSKKPDNFHCSKCDEMLINRWTILNGVEYYIFSDNINLKEVYFRQGLQDYESIQAFICPICKTVNPGNGVKLFKELQL